MGKNQRESAGDSPRDAPGRSLAAVRAEVSEVLFAFFLTCCLQVGVATVLLIALGSRLHFASRAAGLLLFAAVVVGSGQLAADAWSLPGTPVEVAEVFLAAVGLVVIAVRRVWNPVGQLFFASFVAASLAYVAFAAWVTFAGHLTIIGEAASAALLVLEFSALTLASSFAFETCDVVARARHSRGAAVFDPAYLPKVSLHIPAYNEPPEMLIQTIKSAEQLDYPDFEIVVIDNNTTDPDVWRPVEQYCLGRPGVLFVHVENWPGFKSGALNLALSEYTDPAAEIVGVIDADYEVDEAYLRETVGYFADPQVAFVQSPQDYRGYQGSPYFTACYDAYRYFFATAMPSRNERNSIIFAGTMGLLRRPLLEAIGGWDEWCITEDAETSLRMLAAGYSSHFVARSFGRGIMPLTFAALKKQRFRWCFGGMQILRRHWRMLIPGARTPGNRLTNGQRLDYLFGGLQWLNDLILLGFSVVLVIVGSLLLAGSSVAIRPLVGPMVLLPAALLASGLLRAVWALRQQTGITVRRALLAFASWLSLSLTVARACLQGLVRSEGVFMRTPKTGEAQGVGAAIKVTLPETTLGLLLWGTAAAVGVVAHPTALLLALMAWQGSVYLTSPYMSWLNQRAQLTPELEERRRTEDLRDRLALILRPALLGSMALGLAGAAFVAVLALGASHAGSPGNPFSIPPRSSGDQGPWGGALNPVKVGPTPTTPGSSTTTTTTTPTTIPSSTTGPTVSSTSTTAPAATTIPATTSTSSTTAAPTAVRGVTTTTPAAAQGP